MDCMLQRLLVPGKMGQVKLGWGVLGGCCSPPSAVGVSIPDLPLQSLLFPFKSINKLWKIFDTIGSREGLGWGNGYGFHPTSPKRQPQDPFPVRKSLLLRPLPQDTSPVFSNQLEDWEVKFVMESRQVGKLCEVTGFCHKILLRQDIHI